MTAPDNERPWDRKVEPTLTPYEGPGRSKATLEQHPAYGTICANRVSGQTALFQSDFWHSGYIKVTISRAEVVRDLSHDWVHSGSREELIEVELSEAQWASFVSTMNVHAGTPCTLRRIGRDYVPGILAPKLRNEQFKTESGQAVQEAIKRLSSLVGTIRGMGLSKVKETALLSEVEMAARGIRSTQDHIAKQFAEHVETTVEHAKAEVAGYVSGAVRQLGIQALAAGGGATVEPLRLDFPGSDA